MKTIMQILLIVLVFSSCFTESKNKSINNSELDSYHEEISLSIQTIEKNLLNKGIPDKYKENDTLSQIAIAKSTSRNILNYRVKIISTKDCIKSMSPDSTHHYERDSIKVVTIQKHFKTLNNSLKKQMTKRSFMINSERINLLINYLDEICQTDSTVK